MSIQNPYDHALKILARTYPEEFLRLGFPEQTVHLLGTLANVELALEIDRVDFLHKVELQGTEAYLHIDFQLEHEADCPRRFFVYNAMLSELKKPTPIITLPVYLRPRIAALPNSYEVKIGETVFHRFTYQPLKLWDYVEQIRSGLLYIFAPLLPLLVRPINEEMLIEERGLILAHEKDTDRQHTLLTTAILIAAQSKLFSSDFLWTLFKEDTMDLDNPVIAKLFDRAYGEKLATETQKVEQKFQEELALAMQRAAAAEASAAVARREAELTMTQQWQELMFKVLEHRFTSIPVALVLLLQAVKPSQRSRVNDIILDSPDVDACLQAMRQLQAEA